MNLEKHRRMTIDDFERFITQPENEQRRWEFIDGEVIEVPSNPLSSQIAALIIAALVVFVRPRGLGHVTGEAAGYKIEGRDFSPDVAFVSKQRQSSLPYREQYNPVAPDLMVEVLSPSNKTDKREREVIEDKIRVCAYARILLWIVDPELRSVKVYTPGQPVRTIEFDGVLNGGDVLSGFELPVKDIFPE
ncbi:MAG: Uma2 family endonuclease [Chloroflexota bacterium]